MKCVVCDKVKGKRYCPAKNGQICAKCCGEKRVLEIACPETCPYLSSGLSYQMRKKRVNKLQHEEDPLQQRKYYEVHQKHSAIMTELEETVIVYARGLRSLCDQHVRDAVALTLDTYKTEQKGIIYEHTATDPLVNSLARELRQRLESHRQIQDDRPFLRTGELVDCLGVFLADIDYHLQQPGGDTFLQFITRSRPDIAKTPSQRLII